MGRAGSEFRLIFRMAHLNQLDFSAILAVRLPKVTDYGGFSWHNRARL